MEVRVSTEPTGAEAPAKPPAGTPPVAESTPAPKPAAPAAEPAKPDAPPAKPEVPRIEKPAEPSKLDLSAALSEFGKDGKLTDATYAAYEKQGMTRGQVDTFIAGHQAQVNTVVNSLTEIAGDQATLKAVVEWAGANTDTATADAFNAAIDRGDGVVASLMLRGLMAQYGETVGVEGERILGSPKSGGIQPYKSMEQVRVDMSNKKYNADPEFREMVARRMAVSFN